MITIEKVGSFHHYLKDGKPIVIECYKCKRRFWLDSVNELYFMRELERTEDCSNFEVLCPPCRSEVDVEDYLENLTQDT